MISYQEFSVEQLPRVLEIYEHAGWTAYLGDTEGLERAFRNSLCAIGAFDGPCLVGFVRCVGDGAHVLYVQDLIVDPPYQRRGIGGALLHRARERYAGVRMFTLATDASVPASNSFYAAMGMKRYENAGIAGYLW